MILERLEPRHHSLTAILLYSGGFDSTTTLLLLKHCGCRIIVADIDYPTRPQKEREVSFRLAREIGVTEFQTVSISIGDDRALRSSQTDYRYEAWLPHRNIIFLSIAYYLAIKRNAQIVGAGLRVWDGGIFNDSTSEYLTRLETLLQFSGRPGTGTDIALFLPLIHSDAPIFSLLSGDANARAILERTWSCWRDGDAPCGTCRPCEFRIQFTKRLNNEIG